MSVVKRILNNSVVIMAGLEASVGCQTGELEVMDARGFLKWKRPEISVLSLDRFKYKMVYAPIQSGKTSMLICKGLEHALDGRVVVIVVRDYLMDLAQIKRRLEGTLEEMQKYEKVKINVMTVGEVREADLSVSGSVGGSIVLIGNNHQFMKLNVKMSKVEDKREVILMIDEIDVNIKKQKSNLGSKLMEVDSWNVVQRVGVTATAMGMLYSDYMFESSQLVVLKPRPGYVGVRKHIKDIGRKIEIAEVKPGVEDMYKVYDQLASTEFGFKTGVGRPHPCIILNKTKTEKVDHEELLWDLYYRYYEDVVGEYDNIKYWIHVMLNGDGVKILTDWELYDEDGEIYEEEDGLYVFKKMDIASCLSMLKRNMEDEYDEVVQDTVINIIGGQCFSRGISVVSLDYEWHLTHEYYLAGQTTDCGSILQAMRLCGMYSDEIPLRLYTTGNIRNHIKAYASLQDKIIKYLEEGECKTMTDVLNVMVANEKEVMLKRGLGRGMKGETVKIKFSVVKGDQEVNLEVDNENPEAVKRELENLLRHGKKIHEKDYKMVNGKYKLDAEVYLFFMPSDMVRIISESSSFTNTIISTMCKEPRLFPRFVDDISHTFSGPVGWISAL